MGQTLTHGVYLPDEGERNCYSGLAANWQLLDGAVGTIAEHTTQIAGKAPLVHTHTKSDITDLFNSANTWSGEQTFSQTIQGNAATATEFASNQSVTLTGTIEGTASSKAGWTIATNFREGKGSRTSTDLYAKLASGSFSGSWNVYNAIFMCCSSESNEVCILQLYLSLNQSGTVTSDSYARLKVQSINGLNKSRFVLVYKNDTNRVLFELYAYNPSANQGIIVQLQNEFIRSSNKQSINIQMHSGVIINALPSDYTVKNAENGVFAIDLIPKNDNTFDLGSTTQKWKTLNGVNPGALSLPDTLGTSGTENVNYFNVIGYLNNTGTLATIPATATYDGWLYINAKDGADSYITVDDYPSGFGTSVFGNNGLGSSSVGLLCLICPIRKGHSYNVRIKSAGIVSARIYPAQGNV